MRMSVHKRRTPPKSRVPTDKVRVAIRPAAERRGWDEAPGYAGHNGGSFSDAGYRSGTGTFGFQQQVV